MTEEIKTEVPVKQEKKEPIVKTHDDFLKLKSFIENEANQEQLDELGSAMGGRKGHLDKVKGTPGQGATWRNV